MEPGFGLLITGLVIGTAGAVCKTIGDKQDEERRREEENEKKD